MKLECECGTKQDAAMSPVAIGPSTGSFRLQLAIASIVPLTVPPLSTLHPKLMRSPSYTDQDISDTHHAAAR